MTSFCIENYEDIDWLQLWQNGRKRKSWQSKGAADWDKKAPSFAQRNLQSAYASLLLSRLPLEPSFSVLDIGSGPGTLALPLAEHVKKVTAIDYSRQMIEILKREAWTSGFDNVSALQCSWEDDWPELGIEPADLAIASRSMNVDDISMAIDKLDRYSTRYSFITDRIAPSPFDPEVFTAIGRPFNSGPDYIFTLNLLYSKGIHPCVETLQLERTVEFSSMDEALQSYRWMIKDITDAELAALQTYLHSITVYSNKDRLVLRRAHPPRWAMIWWEKEQCR